MEDEELTAIARMWLASVWNKSDWLAAAWRMAMLRDDEPRRAAASMDDSNLAM